METKPTKPIINYQLNPGDLGHLLRLPALAAIEGSLRARQRTAALGALFAVVGLQSMVGLMVAKVWKVLYGKCVKNGEEWQISDFLGGC